MYTHKSINNDLLLFRADPVFVILFWLVLFFVDPKKNTAKRIFMFFLSLLLVNYIIHWLYFNKLHQTYHLLDSVWTFTSLSIFPLYYYYIRLLARDQNINYKWGWILIPASMLSIFSAIIYFLMSPHEIEILSNEILYSNRPQSEDYSTLIKMYILKIYLFNLIFKVEAIAAVFYGFRLIKRFNLKLKAYYSDTYYKELYNIGLTLFFLLAAAIISILSSIVGKTRFVQNPELLALPSIAHSFALFGLSYGGYKQSFSIREFMKELCQKQDEECDEQMENAEDGVLLGSIYDELYVRMEYLLSDEQIFRDPDLNLDDLTSKLGTNRTYVSRLINNKTQYNFRDYINSYRIRFVKEMLASDKGERLTLEKIAIEAGFSSESSFYRVFSKMEGTTPAKYRKKIKTDEVKR